METIDGQTGEIVHVRRVETAMIVPGGTLWDREVCEHVQQLAVTFSNSDIVPAHYRGKQENCFIAIHRAQALEMDPLSFMQHTYIVHGKLGMEGKLAIALVNKRGPFREGIQWDMSGEGSTRQATAWGMLKSGRKRCESTVSYAMAVAEGWTSNAKWQTMTDLMLQYRSAMFLARLYCPDVLLGMYSADELRDIEASTPPPALESGKVGFGAKGQAQLDAKMAEEARPEATVPAEPEPPLPEPPIPPEPAEATFVPAVGQFVQNGPRGQAVRVVSLDPPTFVTAKGSEHKRERWPDKIQPWVPKGDERIPPGFAMPEPAPSPQPEPPPEPHPDLGSEPADPPGNQAEEPSVPESVPPVESEPLSAPADAQVAESAPSDHSDAVDLPSLDGSPDATEEWM